MFLVEKIYNCLPYPFQNLACFMRSLEQRRLRFGGSFFEKLKWLENTQWWSEEQVFSYQNQQLERLIKLAFTAPYYKSVFRNLDISPEDIVSRDSLKFLPPLNKEILVSNLNELFTNFANRNDLVPSKTGGSTGKSVSFFLEPEAIQFRWAVWWRHKTRFGVRFNSPYATFTGLPAVPLSCNEAPFWRENRLMNQTVFNMHHIVSDKIGQIVDRLNRGGFVYYSGYPSILYHLACLVELNNYTIQKPPQMIFTGAEALMPSQKETIERVLHAPVSDLYGFSEGAGNASKCEYGVYHEDFEFGILECYQPEDLGNRRYRGEILATGFASKAMPLIRYRVGDVGVWEDRECKCGRKSKVLINIEGRIEDYVVLPEGSRIRRFDYIFKDSGNVIEAQVVQERLGAIKIKLVKRDSFTLEDEKDLRKQIYNKISRNLEVDFEYVSEIPREANGKFRAVKSLLKAEQI